MRSGLGQDGDTRSGDAWLPNFFEFHRDSQRQKRLWHIFRRAETQIWHCYSRPEVPRQGSFTFILSSLWSWFWFGWPFGILVKPGDTAIYDWFHLQELNLDEFITHEVSFHDINKAFDLLLEGKSLRCVIWIDKQNWLANLGWDWGGGGGELKNMSSVIVLVITIDAAVLIAWK